MSKSKAKKSSQQASKKTSTTSSNKKSFDVYDKRWYLLLGILLLTLFVYLPVKDAGFVNWDDGDYVLKNTAIQSFDIDMIKTTFLSGVHPDYPPGIASNYHPLTMISLAANYKISGLNPAAYHWTNLILHLINTCLVFIFLQLIFNRKYIVLALLGAACFAWHPMHVESVAWISERKDVLFAAFYLLGLIFYLKSRQEQKAYGWGVMICFVASLLSKPTAVTFPIVLVLIDWMMDKSFELKGLLLKIPYFVLAVIVGLITISIQTDAIGEAESYSIVERLYFGSYGLMYYLWKFVVPHDLATFYPYPNSGNVPVYMMQAPIPIMAGLIWIYYFKRKASILIFGCSFFIVAHLLTLQFFQVGASLVSERYTYLSYIGLSIAFLYLLQQAMYSDKGILKAYKTPIYVLLMIWLLMLAYTSHQQTKTWKNGQVLWENVLDKFPNSSFGLTALGHYYIQQEDYKKAIVSLDKAKKFGADSYDFLNKRGNALRQVKRLDEALVDLNLAIEQEPELARAYKYRANVFMDQNKLELAMSDYQKSLEIEPQNYDVLGNLGAYYFKTKQYDKAIEQYDQFIKYSPEKSAGYMNKAAVYLISKQYDLCLQSLGQYEQSGGALQGQFHYYKAICFEKTDQFSKALEEVNKAIPFNPKDKNYQNTKKRLEKRLK